MDDLQAVERLSSVFLDSFFVIDRHRTIRAFNTGFVQLLGLRPPERRKVIGTACSKLLCLEICREHCVALECLARGGNVRRNEIRGTTHDGRELVLELSAIPLCDSSGQVSAVFVTHRDVTDERHLKIRFEEGMAAAKIERDALLKIINEQKTELGELHHRLTMRR